MQTNSNGPVYAMVGLVAALAAIVAVVSVTGTEASSQRLITFIGTVVPLVLGYVFLGRKMDAVKGVNDNQTQHIENIESNVNGKLDRKFVELHQKIDALSAPKDNKEEGM